MDNALPLLSNDYVVQGTLYFVDHVNQTTSWVDPRGRALGGGAAPTSSGDTSANSSPEASRVFGSPERLVGWFSSGGGGGKRGRHPSRTTSTKGSDFGNASKYTYA